MLEQELQQRSESKCELCSASENLNVYEVPPNSKISIDDCILLCEVCSSQLENTVEVDLNHWRCLNDSMWSQVPAVQVVAWRMLTRLKNEGWPQDLLDMLYLDDETLSRAQVTGEGKDVDNDVLHLIVMAQCWKQVIPLY